MPLTRKERIDRDLLKTTLSDSTVTDPFTLGNMKAEVNRLNEKETAPVPVIDKMDTIKRIIDTPVSTVVAEPVVDKQETLGNLLNTLSFPTLDIDTALDTVTPNVMDIPEFSSISEPEVSIDISGSADSSPIDTMQAIYRYLALPALGAYETYRTGSPAKSAGLMNVFDQINLANKKREDQRPQLEETARVADLTTDYRTALEDETLTDDGISDLTDRFLRAANPLEYAKLQSKNRGTNLMDLLSLTIKQGQADITPFKLEKAESDAEIAKVRASSAPELDALNVAKARLLKDKAVRDKLVSTEMLKLKKLELKNKITAVSSGTPLKTAERNNFSEGATIPQMLDYLKVLISTNKDVTGPIAGRFNEGRAIAGFTDDTVQRYKKVASAYRSAVQLAGTYLEGGKLIGADEEKYRKMLGDPNLPPELALIAIDEIKKMVTDKYNNKFKSYESAGYNMTGVNNLTPEFLEEQIKRDAEADAEAGADEL